MPLDDAIPKILERFTPNTIAIEKPCWPVQLPDGRIGLVTVTITTDRAAWSSEFKEISK